MLAESESKISQRFLQTDCRFGTEAIEIWQSESRSRCSKKEKDDAYLKYIHWKEKHNEIALFTLYAYADLKVPKEFSCIFDYRNPERFFESKMNLTQSILEAWYPINTIDHGHKHLAIFKFEEEIPSMVLGLHLEKQKFSSVPKNSLMLGICQIEDYETIKKYLLTVTELRKKHGTDWFEFYEEEEK
jgi:hypothetical protein